MATSKLQIAVGNMLDRKFPNYTIRENYRPDWLISSNITRLELDFYIENISTAIEVQGIQHYEFIDFFYKTPEEFEKRKLYDREKKDLCDGRGVKLIEVFSIMDAIVCIKSLGAEAPEHLLVGSNPITSNRGLIHTQGKRIKTNPIFSYWNELMHKYQHDRYTGNDDPKINEIRKFYHKLIGHYKGGRNLKYMMPQFHFDCLEKDEQEALLESTRHEIKLLHACY